ncbi:MAG: glycoside hydrolase family 2 protein [Actinobacteria bacterium]|nr:glycoside hydrolase family 2 protein [Actinomycetota bacterium]
MNTLDLAGRAWTVRADVTTDAWAEVPEAVRPAVAAGVPASVPGCVHTDLMAAGLLADPYLGAAEADQVWVGRQTWVYRCTFDLPGDAAELTAAHCDLVCEGLDTVAAVSCNDVLLGRTANMHRRYTFAAREALRAGGNVVEVRFGPALEHAAAMQELVGARHHVEADPYNLIRKMACNFGWDWGPRLVTCGIWKPISLVSWDAVRIAEVTVLATVDPAGADPASHRWAGRLAVAVRLDGDVAGARVRVGVADAELEAEVAAEPGWTRLELEAASVRPWWPHPLGKPVRYDVAISVLTPAGEADRRDVRTGFRSTALDTTPDADGAGSTFGLRINGVPVFVRGANWIPDDCFVTRVTPERYRERIRQARDANIDLLRVWGGGIYETDEFYAACDELGMLVWQDFCLACSPYPEEEPFWSELEAEARDNVTRLSPHPSLVVWNGNNEATWGHEEWGWQDLVGGDLSWGGGYYDELFPRIMAELDPSRPYWAGSPSSGVPGVPANSPDHGCMHIWDVWNDRDYTGYDDYSPRFVSEFGYQGPATWTTWARTLAPDQLAAGSAHLALRQRAANGDAKLNGGLAGHLPVPGRGFAEFDDWLFTTQLQQARAIRYGIERWRSLRGHCRGSIVWQLNDCWPSISWSALDSGTDAAGRPVARRKPLWYAIRSAYDDHLVTIRTEGDPPRAVLVNDADAAWAAVGQVELRDLSGHQLWTVPVEAEVPPRSTVSVPLPALPSEVAGTALVATLRGAERCVRLLAEDVAAGLPQPRLRASVSTTGNGAEVTLTASTFVRSLCLFADRVAEGAQVDTMLVDLFPGERHTFVVTGNLDDVDLGALTRAPALRSSFGTVRPTTGES